MMTIDDIRDNVTKDVKRNRRKYGLSHFSESMSGQIAKFLYKVFVFFSLSFHYFRFTISAKYRKELAKSIKYRSRNMELAGIASTEMPVSCGDTPTLIEAFYQKRKRELDNRLQDVDNKIYQKTSDLEKLEKECENLQSKMDVITLTGEDIKEISKIHSLEVTTDSPNMVVVELGLLNEIMMFNFKDGVSASFKTGSSAMYIPPDQLDQVFQLFLKLRDKERKE